MDIASTQSTHVYYSETLSLKRVTISDACLIVFELQLWMGTHKKGESRVSSGNLPLSQWLSEHPAAMGHAVAQHFSGTSQLPFLFKVLSVAKSLSIQAHPNKVLVLFSILCLK